MMKLLKLHKITEDYFYNPDQANLDNLKAEIGILKKQLIKFKSVRSNWANLYPFLINISDGNLKNLESIDIKKINLLKEHNYPEFYKLNKLENSNMEEFIKNSGHKFNNGQYFIIDNNIVYHQLDGIF